MEIGEFAERAGAPRRGGRGRGRFRRRDPRGRRDPHAPARRASHPRRPRELAHEVQQEADRLIPLLEHEDAAATRAKAWRMVAFVHGVVCHWQETADALERAIAAARLADDQRMVARLSSSYVMALSEGPTPAPVAIERAEEVLRLRPRRSAGRGRGASDHGAAARDVGRVRPGPGAGQPGRRAPARARGDGHRSSNVGRGLADRAPRRRRGGGRGQAPCGLRCAHGAGRELRPPEHRRPALEDAPRARPGRRGRGVRRRRRRDRKPRRRRGAGVAALGAGAHPRRPRARGRGEGARSRGARPGRRDGRSGAAGRFAARRRRGARELARRAPRRRSRRRGRSTSRNGTWSGSHASRPSSPLRRCLRAGRNL